MSTSRRLFLKQTSAVALGFGGLHTLLVEPALARPTPVRATPGYGPILLDPDGILDLPDGFSYTVVSRMGNEMSDGLLVPGAPDGMATFAGPDGRTRIVRNHEIDFSETGERGAFGTDNALFGQLDANLFYDAGREGIPCLGGTTTLIYNTRTQELERQYLSLAGTVRNCAGGPTPWNSWVTCEESVQGIDDRHLVVHGYNFEVPAWAGPGLVEPIPLKAMGRFNHEAIAVDPNSGIVYQTEDRHDSLIYRFIPEVPGQLVRGGRLQALVVRDHPGLDTRNWEETLVEPGTALDVTWIDLDEIDAPNDDLRLRGFDNGAARFARGEGMWYGHGTIYFACTNGGTLKKGQIWKYTPSPVEGTPEEDQQPGRLELFIEPNDGTLIENADNLTVAPWGDLFVCEDGPDDQFVVGVTPDGELYRFAHNSIGSSEFAGATFSPDGTTFFVNIQSDGLTLAVTGPW